MIRTLYPLLGIIAFALLVEFAIRPAVGPFYARILLDIGITIILAVSLNIVNGLTGQFSIGHAGFMAVGGYAAGMITYYGSLAIWGDTSRHGGVFGAGEWLLVAGCLVGGFVAAGLGYVVGLPSLRLRGDYLAIVTLGFGEIIRVLLQQTGPVLDNWDQVKAAGASAWFPPPVGGSLGFSGLQPYTNLLSVSFFAGLTVVAAVRLKQSSTGRALLAIRQDEIAAQSMGVDVTRLKVHAFVLSAFLAGIAGGLFAHESGVILSPTDAGFQRSFDLVIIVVLGGLGSISGAILTSALLAILTEALRGFEGYRLIVYALLLIIIAIARPQGMLGLRELWDWLPGRRRAAKETP